jgi:2-methylcitrate dehydratase
LEHSADRPLPNAVRETLKIHLFDSIVVAFGALRSMLPEKVRNFVCENGPPSDDASSASLIGGGRAAMAHTAFFNSTLIRYLDFNDSYLAPGETFHPSDVFGGLWAAAESLDRTGLDLLRAGALSYQIQARLSEEAPVRKRGFDHTTQLAYAAAGSIAFLLGLDREKIAHAIAIAGTAHNPLRVTRTGTLSHWKGLAAPYTIFHAMNACLLARVGVTGPPEIFEGNKGFEETISGPFHVDWAHEPVDAVTRTILKRYNAEVHSQSAIEAVLDLKAKERFSIEEIVSIDVETFDVAYHIIGGGEEGPKWNVRTKEEADHSLAYVIAVALLDGTVMPAQYEEKRIHRADVQTLIQKINITPSAKFSSRFPKEMPVRVSILTSRGRVQKEKRDYLGFTSRPMSFEGVMRKFKDLTQDWMEDESRSNIAIAVDSIEHMKMRDFMKLLAKPVAP